MDNRQLSGKETGPGNFIGDQSYLLEQKFKHLNSVNNLDLSLNKLNIRKYLISVKK
jgi:hypothetical protein